MSNPLYLLPLAIAALQNPVFSQAAVQTSDLDEMATQFWSAPEDRDSKITLILEAKPSATALAKALARGWSYKLDAPRGWMVRTILGSDGQTRPYHLFVPKSYTPSKAYPLLVQMHGGVSRTEMIPEVAFSQYREQFFAKDARENEYILVLPLGQKGAVWWDKVGSANVLGIQRDIASDYHVDQNRIFATGFSDGGSGAFFFGFNRPTAFAGFIPLNGMMLVAQVSGHPCYLPNATNKPYRIVNTDLDSLYPSKIVDPMIAAMREMGVDVEYKVYKGIGHSPSYLPEELPAISRFMKKTERHAFPQKIDWECSDTRFGRCHWLRIEELGKSKTHDKGLDKDLNPLLPAGRVRVGIQVDQEFSGPGVRIDKLADGDSPARQMGIAAGDVLLEMDGKELKSLMTLRALLSKKSPGDDLTLKVSRGDEVMEKKGSFAKPKPRKAFRRDKPSGRVLAQRKGNGFELRVRGVKKVSLLLAPELVDLEKPVQVRVNGKLVHDGIIQPDIGFMLRQAAKDLDPRMISWARLEVSIED